MPKIFNRAAFEVSNSDAARFCKLCFQPRSVGCFFESVLIYKHVRCTALIAAQLPSRHGNTARTQSAAVFKSQIKRTRNVITFKCNGWELRTTVKTVEHRIDCSRNDGCIFQFRTSGKTKTESRNAFRHSGRRRQTGTTIKTTMHRRNTARNARRSRQSGTFNKTAGHIGNTGRNIFDRNNLVTLRKTVCH